MDLDITITRMADFVCAQYGIDLADKRTTAAQKKQVARVVRQRVEGAVPAARQSGQQLRPGDMQVGDRPSYNRELGRGAQFAADPAFTSAIGPMLEERIVNGDYSNHHAYSGRDEFMEFTEAAR